MADINENLATLSSIKSNIKSSIENKAEHSISDLLTTYADEIDKLYLDSKKIVLASGYRLGYSTLKKIPTYIVPADTYTRFNSMFAYNTNLTEAPNWDTSNITNTQDMFAYCSSLVDVPDYNLSNNTNARGMFFGCTSLTTLCDLYMPLNTTLYATFYNCTSLTTLGEIDCTSVTDIRNCLGNCSRLVNFGGFKNISINFSVAYCTQLSKQSLLNIIDGLVQIPDDASYFPTVTLGSKNSNKLTINERDMILNKNWQIG